MKLSAKFKKYIRKTHRYFGLIIGIQFLLWTLGGLYFSWSDIDEIHGDFNKNETKYISVDQQFYMLDSVLSELKTMERVDSVRHIKTMKIIDTVYYQILYFTNIDNSVVVRYSLINAATGQFKKPVTVDEAKQIALNAFTPNSKINSVKLLTEKDVNGHHEYRGGELPAYAVEIDHESSTIVYIGQNSGQIRTFRNKKWRIFDFLWMLHTMDYQNRDDINNYVLKGFSILGLFTVLSGFTLFFISFRIKKKKE